MTRAELIIPALVGGGQHLHEFLPGQDRRDAIRRSVASKLHWSGPGYWCAVTPDGIGDWGRYRSESRRPERRADAVTFITWDEALAIVERGCGDGRRAAYEAAYKEWFAAIREAWAGHKNGDYPSPATPDSSAISATATALIRNGFVERNVQGSLFDDQELAGASR